MEVVTYVTALLAGVVSISSPCVLPLLPGIMAYSTEKSKFTPLAIVLGLAITFTVMGVASSVFGSFFMDYMDYLKLIPAYSSSSWACTFYPGQSRRSCFAYGNLCRCHGYPIRAPWA